jgi:hypothetical protein
MKSIVPLNRINSVIITIFFLQTIDFDTNTVNLQEEKIL